MKSFLSNILFLLLLTVPSGTVFAEGEELELGRYTVKGTVADENGEPLPGASVWVVGATIGAGTNANGEFAIRLNEGREYTLRVSFTGYIPEEVKVNRQTGAQPLHIVLKPAQNELNEIVVTGARIARPLKEVPILTRVISQKDIQALNPMSIETLLQYELPGLQITYNSMSRMPQIKYQGVDGEYMLFLIDGERVSGEGADHNVDFTRFNVDEIERIEFIRGSQSTVYGSNALGGVINIITKKANRPFTGNIHARYAGTNGQKYTISAGTKKDRFSSLTSVTFRTRDTYSVGDKNGKTLKIYNPDGTVKDSTLRAGSTTIYGYKVWDASQKFGYAFTDKLSVDLRGSFYHNARDIREGGKYQDFFIDYALNAKMNYVFREDRRLIVSYNYDNYKKDKDFFQAKFRRTDYRNRTQMLRADYSGTYGDHTVSVGTEIFFEHLKHYMLKDSAHATNENYSLYMQEDWKPLPSLNVIVGVRSDYHRKYHWHVTPKLSAMYRPAETVTIRAGYSQGFRSPSLKELYQEYDMGGQGFLMLYGNPDLKPETSHQFSFSAEYTQGGFNASVSTSHNRFHNKITYKEKNAAEWQYTNAEHARTTSVEAIVQMRMDFGLTMTGSYAYVNDYEQVSGRNTSSVRPHSVTFNAVYSRKFGKIGMNVALNGQWASQLSTYRFLKDGTHRSVTYDARTLCSLNTGVTMPKGVSVNVGVDNLFNYQDKAADSSLQLPQKGISLIGTVNINLADMFGL
ncbi:TonB-dependent receptor [Tannerella forsythia]|uniref:TonB-dependent receptor n=1 Tax=Tannerella forsythia TaxID=28112 RepID=A0A3P1ZAW2_TANFO|nr:TonB-dependent receptor [Tannerella forsythia]RRD79280.1 TonB-dependent receptor [Tannerella forsythia]